MDFFSHNPNRQGGHIFLSHSHDDIERVREIRNEIEAYGFEPLCFYLKCLNDDSEIEDLIKREIDAREWFFFINSVNSRNSKWVKLEREYISKSDKKKKITIDLNDHQSLQDALDKISRRLRIYISYLHRDSILTQRIADKLIEKDYMVLNAPYDAHFSSPDISHNDFCSAMKSAILEASQCGSVLAIITPEFANSAYTIGELEFAASQDGMIIPVLVGNIDRSAISGLLNKYQYYQLAEHPTVQEINDLIDAIGCSILGSE